MWFLTGPKGELIYLKRNSKIVVGRIQGNIILRDDKSVSRNHASVEVATTKSSNGDQQSCCIVKDLESKYGSSVIRGDEKLNVTKEGITVHDNDKIKFGLQNNDYIVSCIPVVVLVSSMKDHEYLESIVKILDGCIVYEWSKKVTHLTTYKAILGEKIALALVNCIPIVGMEYWKAVLDAVENNQEWPKYTKYILPITEDAIDNTKVSLKPSPDRRTLFNNLTFLFFSFSQFKIYKEIIKAAGGKVLMFDASVHTDLTLFCTDEFIVVYYMISCNQTEESILDSQRLLTRYEQIEEILHSKKRRMVSDTEIMLAILHCSLEKNCNPKFNYKQSLLRREKEMSNYRKKDQVIALDTQDVQLKSTLTRNNKNIIAETNEFTSQELGESQENTQWSNISSSVTNRSSLSKFTEISSIRDDSQESTDVEIDLVNLNVSPKRSEKRGAEPLNLPAKKAKVNAGSLLFPVMSKNKSQDKFVQNQQGLQRFQASQISQNSLSSQDLQSSQSNHSSSRSNTSVLFSRETTESRSTFSLPSTSNDSEERLKRRPVKNFFDNWSKETSENEILKEVRGQTKKRDESNMQSKKTDTPATKLGTNKVHDLHSYSDKFSLVDSRLESGKRRKESENQFDLESRLKKSLNESIICGEPVTKKKKIKDEPNSSSEIFQILEKNNDKRKRDSDGGNSDCSDTLMRKKQKNKSESFNTIETNVLTQNDKENQDCIFVNGLIRDEFHSSLLDRTFGHKMFHKVYSMTPRIRITQDSMVSHNAEIDENLE